MAKRNRKNSIFDTVEMARIPSASFDLSHNKIFSLDMGKLVPTMALEVLPGDSFSIQHENFLRFAPLISPVMHQIDVKTYDFFIPTRLLWEEFPDWITGESTAEAPYYTGQTVVAGWENGCLADYMGIPATSAGYQTQKISPMVLAAYYLVYDEYFRDQNLVSKKFVPLVAGDNSTEYLPLAIGQPLNKAWEHDYFTSCLPWAQKGDPVTLPLIGDQNPQIQYRGAAALGAPIVNLARELTIDNTLTGDLQSNGSGHLTAGGTLARLDLSGTHDVDINAEASTINTLRRAFAMQKWLETNARGGSRYIESIKAHWGQSSSDARLQRPEYIGQTKQVMRISEVLSTAQTIDQSSNDVPVGNLAGHGISIGGGSTSKYHAEEHGFIITVMTVIPKTSYYQGIHRMFQRFDPFDYAIPSFANIGEQPVYVKELRNDVGLEGDLEEVFGYQMRYAEYKFHNSSIAGDMRGNLDFYHLARRWDGDDLPALNEEFIESVPDKRIFAVIDPNLHSIYAQTFHNVRTVRKLPRFGVPTI